MIGLVERVAATMARYRMVSAGQRVGVAVSGGQDSVCLLHVLRELAPRWQLSLRVLHVNHGLRGAESAADAEFVRDLAARHGTPFDLREIHLGGIRGNLEEAAREARLAFFREAIASGAVDRVAVGHTGSDQAETVLFRFLRGSGTAGLAGIRATTADGLVRPLLEVNRGEVEAYLRERNLAWREDSSNAGTQFARNRIRHILLPLLEREWNPGIRQNLAHTADWAAAEESYWEAEIDRLAEEHLASDGTAVVVGVDVLARLPLAVARRLIRRAVQCVRGDLRRIDFGHVESILELAARRSGNGRVSLPDLEVCRSFDWLRFARGEEKGADYRLPVTVPGAIPVSGTGRAIWLELIEKKETSAGEDYVYNDEAGCLDWGSLRGPLELRNWRPGDRYQPAGSAGAEKIKTLLQRARIPLWERRLWPVLLAGNSIVWSRHFGPAAGVAAGAKSRMVLRVRETLDPTGEIGIGSGRGGV